MEWQKVFGGSIWPDWRDAGRMVEAKTDDGRIISGRLNVEDFVFDGQDECPVWQIVDSEGSGFNFVDMEFWRFV